MTAQLISLLVSQAQAWEAGGLLRWPSPRESVLGQKPLVNSDSTPLANSLPLTRQHVSHSGSPKLGVHR